MRCLIVALLVASLAVASVAAQERVPAAPKEENCRLAIEGGLEQLRRNPPEVTKRDDADRRKLLDEMERLVDTNRRAGVSECRTWNQMMGKAFNQ